MQTARTLVCRATDTSLRRAQLERDFVLGLAAGVPARGIEIYVLPQDALDALAASLPGGAIADRGVKGDGHGLAHHLLGGRGLRRVRADYGQVGRAEQGIRRLLEAAREREAPGRYFVGVPEPIFDALWKRAGELPGPPARRDAGPAVDGPAAELQELIRLHPEFRIPADVRHAYIGDAAVVRLVHYLIVLAANCDFPVLIAGETGTGKEIVARQIHALRCGADGKCVCVNCSGIPSELLESELFGHVQGAFTGATRNKTGLWQDAQGGTLFLDEIGDMPPLHQAKVLRAIEDGGFLPVGGVEPLTSTARLVSATHRNLEGMVRQGLFREDLYHRLVVIRIRTPALREHPEDIPAIARHLWGGIRLNTDQVLPAEVTALLAQQTLPGNVRELRSLLAGIAMVSYGKPVTMAMARMVLRGRGVVEADR